MTEVVKEKQAIEVFANKSNNINVAQREPGGGLSDLIVIDPVDADAVAQAILAARKECI